LLNLPILSKKKQMMRSMLAIMAIVLVSVQGHTHHPHSTHHPATSPQPSATVETSVWDDLASVCPEWAQYGSSVCEDPDCCSRLPTQDELTLLCQEAEVGTACYGAATNNIPSLTDQILALCPTDAPTGLGFSTPVATSTVEETTQPAEETTQPAEETTELATTMLETTVAPVLTTSAPAETPLPVSTEKAPIPNDVQIAIAVEIELPEDEEEQEAIGDALASSVQSIVKQDFPDVTVLFNGWIDPSTTSRRLLAAQQWEADLIFRSPPAPVSEDTSSSSGSGSGSAAVPVGPVAPVLTGVDLAKAAADTVADALADPSSDITEQIKTKTVENLEANPNFDASKVASISQSLSVPEQTVEPKVVPPAEEEEKKSSGYKAAALIIGLLVAVSVVGSIAFIHFRNKRNEKRARGQLLEDGQAVALTQV